MRVRVALAIAVSLSIAPLVSHNVTSDLLTPVRLAELVLMETATGLAFGFTIRAFFLALEFAGEYISFAIGLSNSMTVGVANDDQMPVIASLISLVAVSAVLLSDLHHIFIRGLLDSYRLLPLGTPAGNSSLREVVDIIGFAFVVALKISGPFIVYSILMNTAFGILNRVVPQFPAYFLSVPFLLIGGLFILSYSLGKSMFIFLDAVTYSL